MVEPIPAASAAGGLFMASPNSLDCKPKTLGLMRVGDSGESRFASTAASSSFGAGWEVKLPRERAWDTG